jgi:hypothetical protein
MFAISEKLQLQSAELSAATVSFKVSQISCYFHLGFST